MFRGRRHPNRRNHNPESQEIEENTSCWRELTELERALISVILVELSFLLALFAIGLAFSFQWSPWSHSEKCGVLCQEGASSNKGGSWRENMLKESPNGDNEEADESWAEIPDELYHFVIMSPSFLFGEDQEDYDNIDNNMMTQTTTSGKTVAETGKTITTTGITTTGITTTGITTTTTGITTTTVTTLTTTQWSSESPPVSILFVRDRKLTYRCTAAVMSSSYALVYNDGCIPPEDYNYGYRRPNPRGKKDTPKYKYVMKIKKNKPNSGYNERYIPRILTFKKLSAMYFEDKYNEVDSWYGIYLKYYFMEDEANGFTWRTRTPMNDNDMDKEKVETVSVDLDRKAVPSSITSSPLYIVDNNSYYLAGFAAKGKIMLNIYFGEYKNWLEKV